MDKQVLDYVLVPTGLLIMVAYHIWLLYQIVKHPPKTVIGINAVNRRFWVQSMMEDASKGVLAVQTLRNNIMASTLLASTAIMLCSVIGMLMTSKTGLGGDRSTLFIYGDKSPLEYSIKLFSIFVCFLMAFLLNVQSIRYYSHSSILINIPYKKLSINNCDGCYNHQLMADYVSRTVNKGSFFWSLGLRAFYFSLPMFLWIFGPIPMFVSCVLMVFMFYFLDVTLDFACGGESSEVQNGDHNEV